MLESRFETSVGLVYAAGMVRTRWFSSPHSEMGLPPAERTRFCSLQAFSSGSVANSGMLITYSNRQRARSARRSRGSSCSRSSSAAPSTLPGPPPVGQMSGFRGSSSPRERTTSHCYSALCCSLSSSSPRLSALSAPPRERNCRARDDTRTLRRRRRRRRAHYCPCHSIRGTASKHYPNASDSWCPVAPRPFGDAAPVLLSLPFLLLVGIRRRCCLPPTICLCRSLHRYIRSSTGLWLSLIRQPGGGRHIDGVLPDLLVRCRFGSINCRSILSALPGMTHPPRSLSGGPK